VKRFVWLPVCAWLLFAQVFSKVFAQVPAELKMVCVADQAELYEVDRACDLSFTLRNRLDLRLESYVIEVSARGPAIPSATTPQIRWCRLTETRLGVGKELWSVQGICQLPVDPATGKAIAHSSRFVEIHWEHGVNWVPFINIPAHPRS
jgi:hypothetical protein